MTGRDANPELPLLTWVVSCVPCGHGFDIAKQVAPVQCPKCGKRHFKSVPVTA